MTTAKTESGQSNIETGEVVKSESSTLAIIFLVIGISLTIGIFIFFIINASYASKKFRWPNLRYKNVKNAAATENAEADYLINGMYL